MRNAWVLLLLAGCIAAQDTTVDETQWHMASETTFEMGFCGDCHYGLTEFWATDWQPTTDGWELTVQPRFPEAPLYGIQLGQVIEDSQWQPHPAGIGETVEIPIDVPTGQLFFTAYGSGPQSDALALTATQQDVVETRLVLRDPAGTEHTATGPEDDLRILVVEGAPGAWTASVTYVDGAPGGSLHTRYQVLEGEVVPEATGPVTFSVPAAEDGSPPPTRLWLRPHHDHTPFQNAEWDSMDSSTFRVDFTPMAGPAPAPRAWNETEIDALWDGDEYLFHTITGSFTRAYLDDEGHNDPGYGSSYPGFAAPDGKPVLPGTDHVRLELTWEPATDDLLGVKLSPAQWPYFFYPDAEVREPGRAVFTVPINPNFWEDPEQTLEWYEPGVVRSYYDIAAYIPEDGQLHVTAIDYEVRAYAVR